MLAAESVMRAWVNAQKTLVGNGNPLAGGAYLRMQASPADGAYAVVNRTLGPAPRLTAESDPKVATATIVFDIYSPTEDTGERAAAALATAIERLTGKPEPCGDTGVWVLVHDNLQGPAFVPVPSATGEAYAFQVGADFVLADYSD